MYRKRQIFKIQLLMLRMSNVGIDYFKHRNFTSDVYFHKDTLILERKTDDVKLDLRIVESWKIRAGKIMQVCFLSMLFYTFASLTHFFQHLRTDCTTRIFAWLCNNRKFQAIIL